MRGTASTASAAGRSVPAAAPIGSQQPGRRTSTRTRSNQRESSEKAPVREQGEEIGSGGETRPQNPSSGCDSTAETAGRMRSGERLED